MSDHKDMPKQVILVRTDLGMGPGKMGSQIAHASLKVFFDRSTVSKNFISKDGALYTKDSLSIEMTPDMLAWKEGDFTKIVLEVKSEEQLLSFYNQAMDARLPCSLIQDNGLTVFDGVKTYTTVAIGPAASADINAITKRLRLLK